MFFNWRADIGVSLLRRRKDQGGKESLDLGPYQVHLLKCLDLSMHEALLHSSLLAVKSLCPGVPRIDHHDFDRYSPRPLKVMTCV